MNKKYLIITIIIFLTISIGIFTFSLNNEKETGYISDTQIVDMIGRIVNVSENITKVASMSSSTTVQIFILAPEKLVGWDSMRTEEQNKYMDVNYANLSYIGGGKKDANYENFILLNPDVIFVGHGNTVEDVDMIQSKFGNIPLIDVEGDNNLSTIPDSMKFIGKILKKENESNDFINFYNEMATTVESRVNEIEYKDKKRVYYAKDENGLKSHSAGSQHTQLIELCGGENVVKAGAVKGSTGISIEQVMEWDPDVIITNEPQFYNKVYDDPLWENIKAVKEKEVYLIPQSPYSWFEGPPGANIVIGIPWTAKVLYPEKFKDMDMKNITKTFYSKYYHYNLSNEEINIILNSSGLKEY